MGKNSRRKKKRYLAKLRAIHGQQNQAKVEETSQQTVSQPVAAQVVEESVLSTTNDPDAAPPKSKVASEIKKIALLMTCLAAVVVFVAIINVQTNYISFLGQKVLRLLHVYGT